MQMIQSRRCFLTGLTAFGISTTLEPPTVRAEPPPETTSVRLPRWAAAGCEIPEYVAEPLLRAEGFTDLRFFVGDSSVDSSLWMARGEIDFDWNYGPTYLGSIERGAPITVLAGLHAGCLELIAKENINSITALKGKRVGVYALSSSPHILVSLMAAYVGLDPVNDLEWVTSEEATSKDLFIDGQIDAFLGTPPEPQELRARKIGHTILATSLDRPWAD